MPSSTAFTRTDLDCSNNTEWMTLSAPTKLAGDLTWMRQLSIYFLCALREDRTAFLWLREKRIEIMGDQGPALAISNTELLMFMYNGCRREAEVIFLLSTYKELVDREAVGKQKELLVGTLRGVLRAKVE